jgi:hypothetical protein
MITSTNSHSKMENVADVKTAEDLSNNSSSFVPNKVSANEPGNLNPISAEK